MKKKVVVGMSGGVDSSVAAYLLKESGYDVIGVTMQIWQDESQAAMEENGGCCGLSAVEDARKVAATLGIPYYVMNFKNDFKEKVIDYFVEEYQRARTPNPCIACNRYVKWESLLNRAMEIGADYIATGHYARVVHLDNGRYALMRCAAKWKDQTYALYNLTQDQLSKTLMPVGDYGKDEIRAIAQKIGLSVAQKPDSQDICFVDEDYASFVEEQSGRKSAPGNFVDLDGNVLGQHKGMIHYTIGQRRGLGLSMKERAYVLDLRPKTNEVVVGSKDNLLKNVIEAEAFSPMAVQSVNEDMEFIGKVRYNHQGAPCRAKLDGKGSIQVTFTEPLRAVAPGQSIVLYDGDIVVGGAVIKNSRLI